MPRNLIEKLVTLRESKIHIKIMGEGFPLFLIHGLGADHTMWELNQSALAKYFTVYALDLPGFGNSDKPGVYTVQYFADILKEIMEAEGLSQINLLGASLGGRVALELAINHPRLVNRLALVGVAGISPLMKGMFSSNIASDILAFAMTRRALVQKILSYLVYDPRMISPILVDNFVKRARDKGYLKAFKQSAQSLGVNTTKFLNSLPKVENETLIIWGEEDKIIPCKDGYQLHSLLPKSKLVIFNKCGHCPFMEKAVSFNKLIIEFLKV